MSLLYFSNKADDAFLLNHCFHFVIYPRRIAKDFGFIGNKTCQNKIKDSFIKKSKFTY